MTTLTNSFEGGTDETTITPANSGGASGDAFGDALNAVYDTARAAHGSVSCRWSVAAASTAQTSWLTAGTTWFARAYVYMTAAPPANMQLLTPMDSLTIRLMVRVMTNRTVQITSSGFGNLGQSATVLPLNQWVRIEAQFIEGTTTAGLCTVRIYTTDPDATTADETVVASSTTIGAFERIRYGANFSGSQTYSLWGDDLGASDVDWLGPATLDADLNVSDSAAVTDSVAALAADTSGTDSGTVTDTAAQAVAGEPEFTFAIDWDGDDDFTTPGDDVTERVLARGSFTAMYGREQTRSLAPASPGSAAFELYNASRDYSPENAASPLAGKIRPARPFRGTLELDGTVHSLFRGHTAGYEVTADPADQSVKVTAVDALTDMEHVKIFTELHRGISTGRAVDLILDAVGWPLTDRDIDRGSTTIAWWWENDTNALDALKRVVASEGPGSTLHADPDGRIVFRGRHHRLLRDASLSVQATFHDGAESGPEPWFSRPFTYDVGWRDVINSVTFAVEERQADGELSDVWTSDAVHTIADGDTVTITAQPSSPFMEAVTPVAGTDYTLISGTVTVQLSRTSGQSTDIILRASGGPASLSDLKLRARAVQTVRTVQVQAKSHPSITLYGERAWPDDAPWAGVGDAAAIASMILAYRAERLPIVSMRLIGTRGNVARLSQQAARDLSDRIHIVETETATDADYFIEQIQHTVTPGPVLSTTFGCEQAPAQVADVFILGSATNGVLGTNRLGRRGIDDPDLMFVLGSATNGVLGDNILAT